MDDHDLERQPLKLSVYEECDPRRPVHESCRRLHLSLPWSRAPQPLRDAMRSGFVFALTVCGSPSGSGSLPTLLDLAFPEVFAPSPEESLFSELTLAARALGCTQFDFGERMGRRTAELAPLFFGGLDWAQRPSKTALARLAFCQCVADSCASRLFHDGRAFQRPPLSALEAFEAALLSARRAPWGDPAAFAELDPRAFGSGPLHTWAPARAARAKISSDERAALDACCSEGSQGRTDSGRL